MIVGIDCDDCITTTTQAVLEIHNMDTGDNLTLDDIKSYHIEDYVSPEYQEDFPKIFLDKRVWKNIKLLPNCVETIQQLHNAGHEIWFVTSTMPENALKKCKFLERTFPFLDVRKHLIITPCKQMINVDILIDDAIHNVENAQYSSILFDYPWNRDLDEKANPNVYRVSGWSDVLKTVDLIQRNRLKEKQTRSVCKECESFMNCVNAVYENKTIRCVNFGEITKLVKGVVEKVNNVPHEYICTSDELKAILEQKEKT